jgi:hypothetical protein
MKRENSFLRNLFAFVVILCAAAHGSLALAQYKVFAWENLDNGVFPDSLKLKYEADKSNVSVFDYQSPGAPGGILNGVARTECGRYGLRFQTSAETRFLGVLNGLTLDRKLLGTKGKALYQADFYLPEDTATVPTVAVVAAVPVPEETKDIWQIYRFGFYQGGRVFFSYANKTPKPIIYLQETADALSLQRPGWHRFQIIFEGQDKIICAVDGKAAGFSPITEGSLSQLQAGIMVTSTPENPAGICYADNLSIQWTAEDVPLPDSPWYTPLPVEPAGAGGQTGAAPSLSVRVSVRSPSSPSPTPGQSLLSPEKTPASTVGPARPGGLAVSPPTWLTLPDEAWQRSLAEQRPILCLFYVPRLETYRQIDQKFRTDLAAQNLLKRYIPLLIDANQLTGGMLAQKFNVFRVPCFIVIGPDKKERARIVVGKTLDWAAITSELQKAASP